MSNLYNQIREGVNKYSKGYQEISNKSKYNVEEIFSGVVNLINDVSYLTESNSYRSTESKLGDVVYDLRSITSESLNLVRNAYTAAFMGAMAPLFFSSLVLGIEDEVGEVIDPLMELADLPYDLLDHLKRKIEP